MSPTAQVEPLYVSAAASRNNASASRASDGLVAFASGHLISLWNSANETNEGTHATLIGHGAEVSALKFTGLDQHAFVSGDAKGSARLWTQSSASLEAPWTSSASMPEGHSGSVSAVDSLAIGDASGERSYLVVTGGSDASIIVSIVDTSSGEARQVQKIDCRGKIPLELALSFLPDSQSLVLAVGSTENKIQLYTSPSASSPHFKKSLSLEGHTDWIRCLSFTTPIPLPAVSDADTSSAGYDIQPGEVLLASGGQDNYIRLWRFTRLSHSTSASESSAPASGLSGLDELEKALAEKDPSGSTAAGGTEGELRVKAHDFSVQGDGEFSCSAEAVLLGHDAWVTGLNWAPSTSPSPSTAAGATPGLRLLSASADRSMILWTPLQTSDLTTSATSTLWTSQHRFGEFSSVTNLGFFGALWGKDARTVLASGWGGSWHVWDLEDEEGGEWEPKVATTGHLGKICQVVWEPKGEYLLSASHDMSTRLHAPWRRRAGQEGKEVETWHELGRPQIHGYPLSSLAFIDRLQFVSGADEKLIRVFDAPQNFVDTVEKLSKVKVGGQDGKPRPMAANVPPLGLSNRAIATQAEADQLPPASNDPFEAVAPVNFNVNEQHPPLEEQLLGSTLWPETEKLYGHSFELVALCSANRSSLIASACKATLPAHALIRLFDTKTWLPVRSEGGVLEGHSLTITKLEFSQDDRWLLSVSRDRTWRVYEKIEGREEIGYRPVAAEKAHARIIWDACWSADSSFFATASRDKTAKIWTRTTTDAGWECSQTLKFDEAATSIATIFLSSQQLHLVSIGLENGQIHLYSSPVSSPADLTALSVLDPKISHVLAVTSLSFCPKAELPQGVAARLASGSEDKSIRIFDIKL